MPTLLAESERSFECWPVRGVGTTPPVNAECGVCEVSRRRNSQRSALSAMLGYEAGAGDGLRTRYLDLGKVALYQVSYSRSGRGEIITRGRFLTGTEG